MMDLTEKQKQVLEEVNQQLIEHFDAYVLVVDVADANDAGDHFTAGMFHGGMATALGLCEYEKELIKAQFIRSPVIGEE